RYRCAFYIGFAIGLLPARPPRHGCGSPGRTEVRMRPLPGGAFLLLSVAAAGAIASFAGDYAAPRSPLPHFIAPYTRRLVPEPVFANTARISQLVREGKIHLSLSDAIALALENNLDLAISRYNLDIADTDVLRASSGAAVRGVATGLIQGTPGG